MTSESSCMIPAPPRLPEPTGITMGVSLAKVGRRKLELEKLDNMLSDVERAKNPCATVIIGEWGSGKSQVIEHYCSLAKERGYLTLKLMTSTAINAMEENGTREWLGKSPVEAIRFIAAVMLASIYDNVQRGDDVPLEPIGLSAANMLSMRPEEAVRAFLERASKAGDKLIFLMDELEDLLRRGEELSKEFLDGLKEFLDGHFKDVGEGGAFEGFTHLILACTPDAWGELTRRYEAGGVISRLASRAVHLRRLSAYEAFYLVADLLRTSYGDAEKVPDNVMSPGIVYAIHRVSLGNPRAIVQAYGELMRKAMQGCPEGFMRPVDWRIALEVLPGFRASIDEVLVEGLRIETLRDIERELRQKSHSQERLADIFKVLVAELRPLSAEEVASLLGCSAQVAQRALGRLKGFFSTALGGVKLVEGYRELKGGLERLRGRLIDSGLLREEAKGARIVYGREELDFRDMRDFVTVPLDIRTLCKLGEEAEVLPEHNIKVLLPEKHQELAEALYISDEFASQILDCFKGKDYTTTRYFRLSLRAEGFLYPRALYEELRFIRSPSDRREIAKEVLNKMATEDGPRLVLKSVKKALKLLGFIER